MRRWLADHLAWAVCVLLALWAPPLAFAMGLDFGILTERSIPRSVFRDPSVITSAVQLALMAAAVPSVSRQRARGWRLLAAALAAWTAHVAWAVFSRARLAGAGDLISPETLVQVSALAVAAAVLMLVRLDTQV